MPLPKGVHILILKTCECVALQDKRSFADVIKNLKLGEVILGYPGGPTVITGSS